MRPHVLPLRSLSITSLVLSGAAIAFATTGVFHRAPARTDVSRDVAAKGGVRPETATPRAAKRTGEDGPPDVRGRAHYKPSPNLPAIDIDVLEDPEVRRVWIDWADSPESFTGACSFDAPEEGDWNITDVALTGVYLWNLVDGEWAYVRVRGYADESAHEDDEPDYVFTEYVMIGGDWTDFGFPE